LLSLPRGTVGLNSGWGVRANDQDVLDEPDQDVLDEPDQDEVDEPDQDVDEPDQDEVDEPDRDEVGATLREKQQELHHRVGASLNWFDHVDTTWYDAESWDMYPPKLLIQTAR
jgi:hypothetical protein